MKRRLQPERFIVARIHIMGRKHLRIKQDFVLDIVKKQRAQDVLEYYKVNLPFPLADYESTADDFNWFVHNNKIEYAIARTMVLYNRLYEAKIVISNLPTFSLNALDFGCGVGDYGIELAKSGACVTFYDMQEILLDFVKFRCKKEGLTCDCFHCSDKSYGEVIQNKQLVVFGEVLEHLADPFATLQKCHEENVKYIWTSAYPCVKNSDYFKRAAHVGSEDIQEKCRLFLEEHYSHESYGKSRFWTLKLI